VALKLTNTGTDAPVIRGLTRVGVRSPDEALAALGSGFASVSATGVGISYNNTGRNMAQTVSIRVGAVDVSVPVAVEDKVATVVVNGLQARVADFVTLSGSFAFQSRPATATDQAAFVVVTRDAAAALAVGDVVKAGVKNATMALVIRDDQKLAFQATGAAELNLGAGFARVAAAGIGVSFNNTGVDVDREITLKVGDVSVSAPLVVKKVFAAARAVV
jgi:hypothetical protein